mgnify:CR=1 FL=1
MAYAHKNSKGVTYYLNSQVAKLRNGREQRIYFFAKEPRPGLALDALPAGYSVGESASSGLPVLKRTVSTK